MLAVGTNHIGIVGVGRVHIRARIEFVVGLEVVEFATNILRKFLVGTVAIRLDLREGGLRSGCGSGNLEVRREFGNDSAVLGGQLLVFAGNCSSVLIDVEECSLLTMPAIRIHYIPLSNTCFEFGTGHKVSVGESDVEGLVSLDPLVGSEDLSVVDELVGGKILEIPVDFSYHSEVHKALDLVVIQMVLSIDSSCHNYTLTNDSI